MDVSSDMLLLSTKLKIPAPRKNYILRRALFDKLSQCADMSVVFVRGGAGTGKTTLLSSFIRETGLRNVCWLSLDESSDNVYSFWLYFTAALSAFWDDGDSFLGLMRAGVDAPHMENLLILLINRLCGDEDAYMVLDDVHCLSDTALLKTFEFFIGAMPSNFHIFMLSREDPPLYLGPLAVSGRLLFIDGRQMQLTRDESLDFLKNTMALRAGDEELDRLSAYAEGWIGGLQLAAAAGKDAGPLLRAGGGIAAEYLTRELFAALSERERDFLTKTGFLSYFDAGLCAALFAAFTQADFDRMVDGLIQRNLFIICVDEAGGVYRYHNILSDYLAQQFSRVSEPDRNALRVKAGAELERRGDFEEALRQYLAAEDYDDVLRLAQAMDGRIEAWRYLDCVPLDRLLTNPDLTAQCFLYNLGNLNVERCRSLYERIKTDYADSDVFSAMQFAEAYFAGSDGILPQYHVLTAGQIDALHFGDIAKAMVLVQNAAALIERSQYEESELCLDRARRISAGKNVFVEFFAYNQLAQLYEETGRLTDSLSCYAKSRELFRSPFMLSGIGTNYYFGLAGVYMRRMELDKARETLDQAQALLEKQRIHLDVMDMTLLFHRAELEFLSGDDDAGAARVGELLSDYAAYSVLTLGRLVLELDCAEKLSPELSDKFLAALKLEGNYGIQLFFRLLRARLLFRRSEKDEAMRETDDVLAFSRLHKNKLHLVEAGLLKILMLLWAGEDEGQREIVNLLREAVHYARKDRILMPFYLDRQALMPTLLALSDQASWKNALPDEEAAFLRDVIALCSPPARIKKDPETLSPRELEVLREMALGLTNREIGEKLCISPATVKTHVLSVFGKLGVASRMAAAQEGRRRGLLG